MSKTTKKVQKSGQKDSNEPETNARPETLLPAELWCTKRPVGDNDGEYEVIIPLIYIMEAVKTPAKFYKFKFIGIQFKEGL